MHDVVRDTSLCLAQTPMSTPHTRGNMHKEKETRSAPLPAAAPSSPSHVRQQRLDDERIQHTGE
jgi:hypothetical protein